MPTLSVRLVVVAFAAAASLVRSEEVVEIGGRRELFVDRHIVGELEGARIELHRPVPRERVLDVTEAWEGRYSGYFTTIHDPELGESGRFRMYYRGLPVARHSLDTEVACIAESDDGIRWTKPRLGLFEVGGSRENNVVLARHRACHNFAPFIDANPDAQADERYKAVGGTGDPGLVALVSADGLHWRDAKTEPIITEGAFDSQNVAFWSEAEGKYVCYFRVFDHGIRWIARAESADFREWSEPVILDPGTAPRWHHYTNQTVPYYRAPHIYLGFPTRFLPGRRALSPEAFAGIGTSTEKWDFRNDCADILLTSTRGGAVIDRSFLDAFIRPGSDPRNWTSRASYASYGVFPTADGELSIWVNRNVGYPTSHIQRFTLRVDGFASVAAPFTGGEMTTKPLRFEGARLSINYATSAAGSVRVEIQNATGEALPGYALEDCDEIIGDELARTVAWKSGADVSMLAGETVRLRFALSDADLYSLRFEPGPVGE